MLHHPLSEKTLPNPPRFQAPASDHAGALELMGTQLRFCRNEEIYGDGEPAEYLYKVTSGTVRTSKILSDGRRQIGAFYLPGDIFGLEAGDTHTSSAEAIGESRILVIKLRSAMDLAARDAKVANQLWSATSREMQRAQAHMLLLIKTAQERVAGFLIDMAKRAKNASTLQLTMSRQDIADYLGLTIETVSRTLSQFERSAAISLQSSRLIEIRNRAELNRLNS